MNPKSIYALFLKVLPSFKNHVSGFKTYGSNAIIISIKDDNGSLSKYLFTIVDSKKCMWTLIPFIK